MFRTALISLFITSTAFADIWIVDDDGKADFDNIQAAVDAASNGDEIIVMPGTYTGTGDQVVDMKGKAIWLHSNDVLLRPIIDGEGARRGILCYSGETAATVIEGFTVQNCSAPWYDWNGDGQTNYWEYFGGGMWNRNGSSPTVLDCHFLENAAEYGAGLYNGDEYGVQSNPTVSLCLFEDNVAGESNCIGNCGDGVGGGMYNMSSNPTITDCQFIANGAHFGGAILNWGSSNPLLTNCYFESNIAVNDGGGVYNSSSMPTFMNCIFSNNIADEGAGVFNADPSSSVNEPLFQHCIFSGNLASSDGGGMHNFSISPVLINCTFKENDAASGGAIYSWNSSMPLISGSLLCGNMPNQISGPWEDNGANTIADECPIDCPDINNDGYVSVTDLLAVIDQWGLIGSPADVTGDGVVNVSDLLLIISNWGPCE